jgi:hypothetical protein
MGDKLSRTLILKIRQSCRTLNRISCCAQSLLKLNECDVRRLPFNTGKASADVCISEHAHGETSWTVIASEFPLVYPVGLVGDSRMSISIAEVRELNA